MLGITSCSDQQAKEGEGIQHRLLLRQPRWERRRKWT
ncbi:DMKN isoform 55 [Pan troglodytes]|uniref:Dermokine n=2 Tax=Homininae TaxID=207598 RepID=M0QZU6_HUMAN|nr:DMKN isoform 2 [Pan troglodytes]PNI95699.1 DMKN isoform 9 [Pan troglodytes]PNI95700.1 DMKN isoform 10 [Pan troglodytes]PNI95702.1 DMKN isoform 12 [Pan troglodytes]PNI95715.1 DMKN isoform 32 [Pan troglodytes]